MPADGELAGRLDLLQCSDKHNFIRNQIGGYMRLRLFVDSVLITTAFAIMSSPTQTAVSVIVMLGILAWIALESRAFLMDLEEWGV